MKRVTAVAVSGGIDSLVAASLIKETGDDVVGIHFTTGFESGDTDTVYIAGDMAESVSRQLGIPVHIMNLEDQFKRYVVDYFVDAYTAGVTPNPCLVCNPLIKFGVLLDAAKKKGASRLATGHYAKVEKDHHGIFRLKKGIDPEKDQSYFLAFLTQSRLSSAYFPLGDLTKDEVKRIAEKKGLFPFSLDESQDICFIRHASYGRFLEKRGIAPRPGPIVDTKGNVLGRHNGLHLFTIGQRRGINCPAQEPYYVLRINPTDNSLVVGFKPELYRNECRVDNINWVHERPSSPLSVTVRIRYSHKGATALIEPDSDRSARVKFESEQPAVTPGQGAVFYQGDEVTGAGWIV